MPPRWESPFDPPSPRDAALLAEVLAALRVRLGDAADAADAPFAGGHGADGEPSLPGNDGGDDAVAEVQELISAAVAELHRVAPPLQQVTGVAPVLGSGVVQELLRRRREARGAVVDAPPPTVDERL